MIPTIALFNSTTKPYYKVKGQNNEAIDIASSNQAWFQANGSQQNFEILTRPQAKKKIWKFNWFKI